MKGRGRAEPAFADARFFLARAEYSGWCRRDNVVNNRIRSSCGWIKPVVGIRLWLAPPWPHDRSLFLCRVRASLPMMTCCH